MNNPIEIKKQEIKNDRCGPCYQAYQILHFAFVIAPIIAGVDKFFNLLTTWSDYLSGPFNILGDAQLTMMIVGAVEIIAGIGVWLKPKYFSYIVALWLLAIIVNLLILGLFGIALRDFGLFLSVLALARLSQCYSCRSCES